MLASQGRLWMCYGTSRRKEKLDVSLCLLHDIISFFQQIFPNLEKNSTSEINLQKTLFFNDSNDKIDQLFVSTNYFS